MAKDKFHKEVCQAIEKEGWTITNDPFYIKLGKIPIQIDLGAEKIIGAEKEGQKIAIEIKTFGMLSFISAFHEAVGQYIVYREALELIEANRDLYLAIPSDVFNVFGNELLVKTVFQKNKFNILVYKPSNQEIISWIKY
jgi:glucose-6-phosphate 1-dehydrogenase